MVFRRVYHAAFREQVPYVVAVVDLAEGVRFPTRLVNVNPEEVHGGMEVEVVFTPATDGIILPLFRPVQDPKKG